MKLCYIWIEKFKSFNNFEINLSQDRKFSYKDGILHQLKNNKTHINLFPDKLIDIHGIIGKNGTGKSNLLELICLVIGSPKSITSDYILVTEDSGDFNCFYNKKNNKPQINFKANLIEHTEIINKSNVAFLSNISQPRSFLREKNIISLSHTHITHPLLKKGKPNPPGLLYKHFNFITSEHFDDLNIDSPSEIIIELLRGGNRIQTTDPYISEIFNKFSKKIQKRTNDLTVKSKFINKLKEAFFYDFVNGFQLKYIINSKESESETINQWVKCTLEDALRKLSESISTEDIIQSLIDAIKDFAIANESFLSLNTKSIFVNKKKELLNCIEFLSKLKSEVGDTNLETVEDGTNQQHFIGYKVSFNKEDKQSIDFTTALIKCFDSSNPVRMRWLGISSGHSAYLNIFSLIYSEQKLINSKDTIICIDEGDLYLHPKWQIEFLDRVISFISKVLTVNVQLFLTSHSPFLVSDLPNSNLSILTGNPDNPIIEGTDLEINTFGANLFDLYSDAFFLENSTTGAFSGKKIQDALNTLEKNVHTEDEIKSINDYAEVIGDEYISYKLKEFKSND